MDARSKKIIEICEIIEIFAQSIDNGFDAIEKEFFENIDFLPNNFKISIQNLKSSTYQFLKAIDHEKLKLNKIFEGKATTNEFQQK